MIYLIVSGHKFVVEFKREAWGTFTYSVPDYALNITIPVDTEFKNNLGLKMKINVFILGFTGANGAMRNKQKLFHFTNVEGSVDLVITYGCCTISG